jgi:hypothetical protein
VPLTSRPHARRRNDDDDDKADDDVATHRDEPYRAASGRVNVSRV